MKKKILIMLPVFVFIFLLAACGNGSHQEEMEPVEDGQNTMAKTEEQDFEYSGFDKAGSAYDTLENAKERSHILVAYFTWAENVAADDIDAMTSASVKSPGNVAQLAQWIGSETGGDLFSIQVTEPYPADWDDCLSRANMEKADDTHPALSKTVEDISEYDTLFLGYPNWWYVAPSIINTFLESYDFTGKRIVPFATSGGSGMGKTNQKLQSSCAGAILMDGKVLSSRESRDSLAAWVDGVNL